MKLKLRRAGLGQMLIFLLLSGVGLAAIGQPTSQSISSGGGRSSVSAIVNDSVVGEISGVSSVGGSWNQAGFLGQWTDVIAVELTAVRDVLPAEERTPILATAHFADGTRAHLSGADPSWSWSSGLASVVNGIATADLVRTNELATVEGRYLGVAGRVDLLVVPAETPFIVTPPRSVRTDPGAAVTFSVEAAGAPPLSYQWFYQDLLIHTATNAAFTVANAQSTNAGLYTVQISNPHGVTVSSASLTLNGITRPEITARPPLRTTNELGSVVVLRVEAAGDPPFSYQWQLNGQNLADRPQGSDLGKPIEEAIARGILFGATNDTLTITNLQLADAGNYSVVVRDGQSSSVVVEPIELVIAGLADLPVELDSARGTNIASTASINPLRVRWRPPVSGVATVTTAGSGFDTLLTVYELSGADARIRLVSDDDAGGFRTSLARFNVSSNRVYEIGADGFAGATGDVLLQWAILPTADLLPRVVQQPANVWALFETNATVFATNVVLRARVENISGATLVWYHNGVALPGPSSLELVLPTVTRSELGQYQLGIFQPGLPPVYTDAIQVEVGTQENLTSGDTPKALYFSTGANDPNRTITLRILQTLITNSPTFAPSPRGIRPASVAQGIISGSQLTAASQEENIKYFGFTIDAEATLTFDSKGSEVPSDIFVGTGPAWEALRESLGLTNVAAPGEPYTVRFLAEPQTLYWVETFPPNGAPGLLQLNWTAELDVDDFKAVLITPTNAMSAVIFHAKNNIAGVAGIYSQPRALRAPSAKASELLTEVPFSVSADRTRTGFTIESERDYWIIVHRLPGVEPEDPLIIDAPVESDTPPTLTITAPPGLVILEWPGSNWGLQWTNQLNLELIHWADVPPTNNSVEWPQSDQSQFFRLSPLPW